MAKSSTTTPIPESISAWYRESIARIFLMPVDHGYVTSFCQFIPEEEFGVLVDQLRLKGGPEETAPVLRQILECIYQNRVRESLFLHVLKGEFVITGMGERCFTWERSPKQLAEMPYDEYLQTEHWKRVRSDALVRADGRCQVCNVDGATEQLHVHHRTYERRGCEEPSDLIVLCKPCHERFHDVKDGRATRMPVHA